MALSLLTLMTGCVEQGQGDDDGIDGPFQPPGMDLPADPFDELAAEPVVPTTPPDLTLAVTVASTPTAKVGLEGKKTDQRAKCQHRTIGACVVERCGLVPMVFPGRVPDVTVAVGADLVAWLSEGEPTSELPPLSVGDTVKVIGPGAAPVTLGGAVPDDLELLEPTGPLEVSGAARQLVRWQAAPDGVVSVTFTSAVAPGYRRATCDFPAFHGAGVIPASVLAEFPASGDAALTMTFMRQGLATGELDGLPTTVRLESRPISLPVTYR